jgi:hypothetical protein
VRGQPVVLIAMITMGSAHATTYPERHHVGSEWPTQLRQTICRDFYAPEWTRTTTGREAHKALNLARLPNSATGAEWASISAVARSPPSPCIGPTGSLVCDHMFVGVPPTPEQGAEQTWT